MLVLPEWLAPEFKAWLHDETDELLQKLIADETRRVWEKLEHDIDAALPRFKELPVNKLSLAGEVLSAICTPLLFFRKGGTRVELSAKNNLRDRQEKALEPMMNKAFADAKRLYCQLEEIQTLVKCEEYPAAYVPEDVLNYDMEGLADLVQTLHLRPKIKDLFCDPGLDGTKSSWRDWKKSAEQNLSVIHIYCRGGFQLREVEWDALTHAVFGVTEKARGNY